jgi:hypothetical protein
MQELLSKTADPKTSASEQEFVELRLDDSDDIWMGRHVIREAHAYWDEALGMTVWDEPVAEYARTPEDAKVRYEARRAALAARGFVYSDMDW